MSTQRQTITLLNLACALVAVSGVARAQTPPPPPPPPAAPTEAKLVESSLADGDTIILGALTDGFVPLNKADIAANKANWTAPPRTKLKVTIDGTDADKFTVVVKDVPCNAERKVHGMSIAAQVTSSITVSDADCAQDSNVSEGHKYTIDKAALKASGFKRLGWIYGGIVIPYKYYRFDKSLEPGTTLGPFLGYRLGQTGWGVAVVGSVGLASLKVASTETNANGDAETKYQTVQGLSRSLGLLFDVTKSETPFRLGIMWGRDRIGSNAALKDPHEGHSWLAVQMGFEIRP